MSNLRNLVVVLLVGLAFGLVWSGRESMGQGKKAKSPQPQWEYTWSNTETDKATVRHWNKLGSEGWEMCGASRNATYFKRLKR